MRGTFGPTVGITESSLAEELASSLASLQQPQRQAHLHARWESPTFGSKQWPEFYLRKINLLGIDTNYAAFENGQHGRASSIGAQDDRDVVAARMGQGSVVRKVQRFWPIAMAPTMLAVHIDFDVTSKCHRAFNSKLAIVDIENPSHATRGLDQLRASRRFIVIRLIQVGESNFNRTTSLVDLSKRATPFLSS